MKLPEFEALGKKVNEPSRRLEIFPKPSNVEKVILESDEVTSVCPVTGQPDWETVVIEFAPIQYCIESKSLKLYLWGYREQGVFCEALAGQIAQDVYNACQPHWCIVTVSQKSRGGIKITATATLGEREAK
jgi:7-cyano-7-deazaguanine reductase